MFWIRLPPTWCGSRTSREERFGLEDGARNGWKGVFGLGAGWERTLEEMEGSGRSATTHNQKKVML